MAARFWTHSRLGLQLDDLRVVELATTNILLRGSREFAFAAHGTAHGTTCASALPQVCAILRPSLPAHGAPCSSMYVSNTQDAGASNPGLRTLPVLVGAARVCATAEEANAVPVCPAGATLVSFSPSVSRRALLTLAHRRTRLQDPRGPYNNVKTIPSPTNTVREPTKCGGATTHAPIHIRAICVDGRRFAF